MKEPRTSRATKTIGRILTAASKRFGQSGFKGASLVEIAREAGVSKGLLHYHFRSKEHLLIEAQRASFRQIYKRFSERSHHGDTGLGPALSALDALWQSIRDLRAGAPFIVETLSLSAQEGPVGRQLDTFYEESTALLEDGIRKIFNDELNRLTVPPRRMAMLIRLFMSGLVVELAQVRCDDDLIEVDQAYADLRELFQRFALASFDEDDDALNTLALPW